MNSCFLDTNVLVYLVDESSSYHLKVKKMISQFEKNNTHLFVSHFILAEFIHVFSNLLQLVKEKNIYGNIEIALKKIGLIPTISIISPSEDFVFTKSVIKIMEQYKLKSNDAYILSILKEKDIPYLATFDQILIKAAKKLNINITKL